MIVFNTSHERLFWIEAVKSTLRGGVGSSDWAVKCADMALAAYQDRVLETEEQGIL